MHMAAKAVHKGIRKCSMLYESPYVIKMDVKKYFENICKDKLYLLIERKIKDRKVLRLTTKILCSSIHYDKQSGIGLPIGNYTSQMFANIYLNELDKFVKNELHVKHYYRYMDDMVLIVDGKQIAKTYLYKIEEFLKYKLQLTLNNKTQIFKLKQGVNFCGYKINEKRIRIRAKGKKKFVSKLKWIDYYFNKGIINTKEAKRYIAGHLGYIKHADISGIIKKYLN